MFESKTSTKRNKNTAKALPAFVFSLLSQSAIHLFYKFTVGLSLLGLVCPLITAQQEARVNHDSIKRGISLATESLLKYQRVEGDWAGRIIMASRHTSYYILASNYTKNNVSSDYQKTLAWLKENQSAAGTWGSMVPQEPVSLSNTAIGFLALKSAGESNSSPSQLKAQRYVQEHGGIEALDPLVQTMYAAFGEQEWDASVLRQFNLELMFLKDTSPLALRNWPPWWREAFVPLALLRTLHSKKTFSDSDKQAIRLAEEWLLTHQLSDGSWFTSTPTFFAVMALYDLDKNKYDKQIKDGFRFLNSLHEPSGYQRPFELSVWDTSLSLLALNSGGYPGCSDKLQPTIDWLIRAQSNAGPILSENQPGGWSYNIHNQIYSDNDDTSLAVWSLSKLMGRTTHLEKGRRSSVQRGVDWLLYMQGDDGGWATFLRDKETDNDSKLPTGVEDPSIPDVTGHVLSALGNLGWKANDSRIVKSLQYLQRSQNEEGAWYGRWGLSYIYGTSAVIIGLQDVGANLDEPWVRKGFNWLLARQNEDGGWGESFSVWDQSRGLSFTKISGQSTAEQTAWSVMALLNDSRPEAQVAVERGIKYLLKNQEPNGEWPGLSYTVLGIDPYANTSYKLHWPLMALGYYQRRHYPEDFKGLNICQTYESAFSSLKTQTNQPWIGGPVELKFTLSQSETGGYKLTVENSSHQQISNFEGQLLWAGTDKAGSTPLLLDELKPSDRHLWNIELPTATNVWDLTYKYLDYKGNSFNAKVTLTNSRKSPGLTSGRLFILLAIIVFVAILLVIVWLVFKSQARHWVTLGWRNVTRKPLRSVLSCAGVVIGTAAIGATLTLVLAFRTKLISDFASFGSNRVVVLPSNLEVKFGPPSDSLRKLPVARFNKMDLNLIREQNEVISATGYGQEDLSVEFQSQQLFLTVKFIDPERYLEVSGGQLEDGNFLRKNSAREVVLGFAVANHAFDRQVELNDKLVINNTEFDVIGIMKEVGGIRGRQGPLVSPDIVLYAPWDEAANFTGRDYFDGIEVRANDAEATERVAQLIQNRLTTAHPQSELGVISSERLLSQVKGLLSQFTIITLTISILTFLVSGIGVANMMLINVRERYEEIGIMKALGASNHTIMGIFIAEAASIGLLSGVAGCFLGGMILLVLQQAAGISTVHMAPYLLVFSFLFSLIIMLLACAYPAYRAAKLEPVEAIRYA